MVEIFEIDDHGINKVLDKNYWETKKRYGEEYIYRQLAEECCELAQACLKDIRVENQELTVETKRGVGKVLVEEIADVLICIGQVIEASGYPPMWIEDAIKDKVQRTKERLEKTFY